MSDHNAAYPEDEPGLLGLDDAEETEGPREPGRRRAERKRRRLPGCLAVLVALAVILGGGYYAVDRGREALQDLVQGPPADYDGPGSGQVTFQVKEGETASEIGRNLKDAGVVASVNAFIEAANDEPAAAGIQVGYYALKREMSAQDALNVLINPDAMVTNTVAVPEGLRVVDVIALLVKGTDYTKRQFQQALANPAIGLPAYAKGNPEGYLFPATYAFGPDARPVDMIKAMVDRWRQAATEAGLEQRAKALGYTPHELMTVASLVEAEAPPTYMTKVARVIYNRLEDTSATGGLLQLDATVNYAHGQHLGARTTAEQRELDSPYNTYTTPGLPPGPIEAPGLAAMKAAGNPAPGDWVYYVTVNLRTGETKFASSWSEHQANVAELNEYCRTQSERC